MIVHLFNSSLVSGPETLVIPALPSFQQEIKEKIEVWNLAEQRKKEASEKVLQYADSFGIKTRSIEITRRFDLRAIVSLARLLETDSPKLVHAHDVKASIYLLLAQVYAQVKSGFKQRAIRLSTHHGIHARNGRAVRVYEWIYRFIFVPFFDQVLVVCSSDREILLQQGISDRRVKVHLNGVDRPWVDLDSRSVLREEIQERWSKKYHLHIKNKIVIGVAARLSPEKNHTRLLTTLTLLKNDPAPWICLCFGVGPLEDSLKQITENLGLSSRVYWCGYESNLSASMAGFDLLLSLSVGEGLPINLLEAGWAGTPVLAARVDGVADLFPAEVGELGLSGLNPHASPEEIAQRITELIHDPVLRQRLGRGFQERVKNLFSGTSWKKRLKEIYQDWIS